MNARLTGIRDFMLLFLFIDLGGRLDFPRSATRSCRPSCWRCSC